MYRRRPWRRVCSKLDLESRIVSMSAEARVRSRGYLPHWEKDGEIYFVTFRLVDSLPKEILQRIVAERADTPQRAAQMRREISCTEKRKVEALYSKKISKYLDAGRGRCILGDPRAARIVRSALLRFDGMRYDLIAWCIMPNHVHVVLHSRSEWKLEKILHSWKSYSTHQIQRAIPHRGHVWQREYYDHLVRHQGELVRVVRYVAENPIRAGLKNWPWVGVLLK
jgi:menaquinone-specific isochorismate synthase